MIQSIRGQAQEDFKDFGGFDLRGGQYVRRLGDEDGPVLWVGGTAAVGAFYQGGVKGDDIHQHAEAEFFLQEPPGDF